MPPFKVGGGYQKSAVFDTTVSGGFAVPSRISYDEAPVAFQLKLGLTVTPTTPSGGFGEFGDAGASTLGGGGCGGGGEVVVEPLATFT